MLDLEDHIETKLSASLELRAQKASMTCFLNALLREWSDWSLSELPLILKSDMSQGIRIALRSATAWIPLKRFSLLGRHEYSYPAFFEDQGHFVAVDFKILAREIIAHLPDDQGSALAKSRFFSRVEDSAQALSEVMAIRSVDFQRHASMPKSFVEAEQHLIIGHSFHPSPKSREGFSPEDRLRYGPEYAGKFPLAWFAVDPKIIRQVASKAFAGIDWVRDLIRSDSALGTLLDQARPPDFLLYPMNPWQAKYLQAMPAFQRQMREGLILFLGEHGDDWYPTSSVRAICRPKSPYMLKTSLHVRLTNSIRSLLLREVDRGIQAHDVLQSQHGQELLARYPNFEILYEPAYWCILDEEGQPIDESIIICRMNPFSQEDSMQGIVLASLTQDNPFHQRNLIGCLLEALRSKRKMSGRDASIHWFDRYLDGVVEPLLMAQADYGILLGAHQQNILIGFAESLPAKLYFRDCQGTGYSEYAYQKLKDEVASLDPVNGNILPSAMANTLFIYYLFINATFNVITSIAQSGYIDESELMPRLRSKLEALLARNPMNPSCIQHLLASDTLLHKGNFLCSIRDINENTSANPLAIYTSIANPLKSVKIQEILP